MATAPPSIRPNDAKRHLVPNRRALHEYDVLETIEAGLVLTGTEIKSVRAGKVQLQDAFARHRDGEVWLHNMHIAHYVQGNRFNSPEARERKLLLHRREIERWVSRAEEKGLTLVPLSIYLRHGFAKVELGLCKGRKLYDRREAIAEREARREQDRALSGRE